MKTKFEANVATEIPKTRTGNEPRLPWDIRGGDIERAALSGGSFSSLQSAKGPLGIRPVYLIALLMAVFIAIGYTFFTLEEKNKTTLLEIEKKDQTQNVLLGSLKKAVNEKELLNKKTTDLERRAAALEKNLTELTEQNKVFVSVIENLSKADEEEDSSR